MYIKGLGQLVRGSSLFYYANCAQIVPMIFMVVRGEDCCSILEVGF